MLRVKRTLPPPSASFSIFSNRIQKHNNKSDLPETQKQNFRNKTASGSLTIKKEKAGIQFFNRHIYSDVPISGRYFDFRTGAFRDKNSTYLSIFV